ncbi:hypothetical protein N7493_009862 [Penicillium malachiteum]|uniref:Uncharacterized protein n=1 Tax=Penicillium malachiteum TaxID=1324776 RepID=A0AAD6HDL9_9EURO|nr:hypothetical protein N7493_009862 [Penicillium malachiteum]
MPRSVLDFVLQPRRLDDNSIVQIRNDYTALRNWLRMILPCINPNGGNMLRNMHSSLQNALRYTNQLLDHLDEPVVQAMSVIELRRNIAIQLNRAWPYVSSFVALHHPDYPRSANQGS